jgi:hypothetical protein
MVVIHLGGRIPPAYCTEAVLSFDESGYVGSANAVAVAETIVTVSSIETLNGRPTPSIVAGLAISGVPIP